jgi:dTDP-4-dehydrorhamnose reductase
VDPLAAAVHELAGKGVSGVVNVAGDERLSKFEFGLRVAERFELPLNWIQRGSVATMKQQITRPLDMSLDNAKARGLLGRSLGSVNDYLADLQTQERTGRRSELAQAVM